MSRGNVLLVAVVFAVIGWFGNQVFGPKERPRETVDAVDPAVSVGTAQGTPEIALPLENGKGRRYPVGTVRVVE